MKKTLDSTKYHNALTKSGLSSDAADDKADLFVQTDRALLKQTNGADTVKCRFFVPGRIEVLGKHTDYAGGRSVVATAERGVCLSATARKDTTVNITDICCGQTVTFELSPQLSPKTGGHWSNYPMTVARRIARNFPGPLLGCDIAFASDLPPAAGMSSSSAMMIAFYLTLAKFNRLSEQSAYRQNIDSMESLAGYLATIENGQNFAALTGDKGVGTFGGSEDHTAILCCKANQLSQYSYCPVRHERFITVPDEYIFAIASSGVVAEKTGAAMEKYNRASLLASAAAQIWRSETGGNQAHLAAILSDSHESASESKNTDQLREIFKQSKDNNFTSQELLKRFEHFQAESRQIIPAAGDALIKKDMSEFGRQVDRSQEVADSLLGNQVPETIFLAQSARQLGASAASAFGAGFGGSIWALIPAEQEKSFLQNWEKSYREKFPETAARASFFTTRPGPAAFEI